MLSVFLALFIFCFGGEGGGGAGSPNLVLYGLYGAASRACDQENSYRYL